MYHSVTFGNKNSYDEWRLVPSSRPVINPPKPKVQYVDIPGADGSIDLTESLAGRPVFEDREGSLEFIVLNEFNVDNYTYNWIDVYSSIMQYLHGQRMTLVLEDEPEYYYEGRFTVNSWKSDQNNSTITIDYRLSPYKYHIKGNFIVADFDNGSIHESGIKGSSNYSFTVNANDRYAICLSEQYWWCAKGDVIHVAKDYMMNIGLYSLTKVPENYIYSSELRGKMYIFAHDGYYRFDIRKYEKDGPVTQSDRELMAAAVHTFSGGVL